MNKIKKYISGLDLGQLVAAREDIDRLITNKENEEKVILWIVEGPLMNEAIFLECDFDKAKEKLCEVILKDSFSQDEVKHDHPRIIKRSVCESEVSGWMDLN